MHLQTSLEYIQVIIPLINLLMNDIRSFGTLTNDSELNTTQYCKYFCIGLIVNKLDYFESTSGLSAATESCRPRVNAISDLEQRNILNKVLA